MHRYLLWAKPGLVSLQKLEAISYISGCEDVNVADEHFLRHLPSTEEAYYVVLQLG